MITNFAEFDVIVKFVGQVIGDLFRPGFTREWSAPEAVFRLFNSGPMLPVLSRSVDNDSLRRL